MFKIKILVLTCWHHREISFNFVLTTKAVYAKKLHFYLCCFYNLYFFQKYAIQNNFTVSSQLGKDAEISWLLIVLSVAHTLHECQFLSDELLLFLKKKLLKSLNKKVPLTPTDFKPGIKILKVR